MNIKKKLTNPFALVAQGFGLGALLFFVAVPAEVDAPLPSPQAGSTSLPENLGA